MSANLDLVRSLYAAFERGNFNFSPAVAHPDVEYVVADGPAPFACKGLAAAAEHFRRDWLSTWEDLRLAVDEYRELDDERVLVLVRYEGRGKASGLELGEMRTQGANLIHVSDGKVTRVVIYMDRDRALADLGLAPEGGSQR